MGEQKKEQFQSGPVIYSSAAISAVVVSVANKLAARLDGQEPTLLILLKGGVRFGCELISALQLECSYDFIGVSSYGEALCSSGRVDFYHYRLNREQIDGRPVVLVDDICDSGKTFKAVSERIKTDFKPASLLSCALIWRDGSGFEPDFFGFHHEGDEFLVGYGLGAGESYRELNCIAVLEQPTQQ